MGKPMQSKTVLFIDDVPSVAELVKKKLEDSLGCTITPIQIDTKNRTLLEILNKIEIEGKSHDTDAVYINAHLTFEGFQHRFQCGGIELFKHIRLWPSKHLQEIQQGQSSLDEIRLSHIILGILIQPEEYIRSNTENLLILSPNCTLLQLEDLQYTKIPGELDGFQTPESMRTKLKDFVVVTPADSAARSHDYKNKVGVAKFFKEFCGELVEKNKNHEIFQEYERMLKGALWLKKEVFLQEGPCKTAEASLGKVSIPLKKFIYIDDEHDRGWSTALYTGLFQKEPKQGRINKAELIDDRFLVIDNFEEAYKFFIGKAEELSSILEQWAKANHDYFTKQSNKALKEMSKYTKELETFFPYDLVFLDLRLQHPEDETRAPDEISGIKLLKQIKEFNRSLPVIVFTASEKAKILEKCREFKADGYWIKDIDSAQKLREIVCTLLKKQYTLQTRKIWIKLHQVKSKKSLNIFKFNENIPGGNRLVLTELDPSGREHLYRKLEKSFQLLWQKDYNSVALLMGTIQEKIRYQLSEEPENWSTIYNRLRPQTLRGHENSITRQGTGIIPEKEVELRKIRNKAAHGDNVSEQEAVNVFIQTLNWFVEGRR